VKIPPPAPIQDARLGAAGLEDLGPDCALSDSGLHGAIQRGGWFCFAELLPAMLQGAAKAKDRWERRGCR
jgi:hypothetical protein